MYNVGQKVVCISGLRSIDGTVELKEGQIYTIFDFNKCKCKTLIDVGLRTQTPTTCYDCNTNVSNNGLWWFDLKRFAPLEEYENHKEEVKQLFKELDLQVN